MSKKFFVVAVIIALIIAITAIKARSFALIGSLSAMSMSQAVSASVFTAGAYICWQNANKDLWQELTAKDSDGNEYTKSGIKNQIADEHDIDLDEEFLPMNPEGPFIYKDCYYTLHQTFQVDRHPVGRDHWVDKPKKLYSAKYFDFSRTNEHLEELFGCCFNIGTMYDYDYVDQVSETDVPEGTPILKPQEEEERFPELFSDENIAETAVDVLDNDLQTDGKNLDSKPEDAYKKFPSGNSNTQEIEVAGVSDKNSSSAGHIITPDGEKIPVSKVQKNSINEELDPPVLDSSGLADDWVIDDAEEGTPPVMIPKHLQELMKENDISGDITGISGNQVKWVDAEGKTHITSVSDSFVDAVTSTATDPIVKNWMGSQSVPDTGTDVDFSDVDGEVPDVPAGAPNFDTSVDLPEKQDIPMSNWVDAIPFIGLINDSGVEYQNSNPVFDISFDLAGNTYNSSVNFSQWSNILSMMGSVIFAVASFVAIRLALIS